MALNEKSLGPSASEAQTRGKADSPCNLSLETGFPLSTSLPLASKLVLNFLYF